MSRRLGLQLLGLVFSPSSSRSRLGIGYVHAAELGPPLVEGGVAEPPLRHSSLIGTPASACLMNPMICSSVNLLFFVSVIRLVDGLPETLVRLAGSRSVFQLQGTDWTLRLGR
jgi:hypothetical protein